MHKLNPKLAQDVKASQYGIDSKDIDRYFDVEEKKNMSSAKENMKNELSAVTKNFNKGILFDWVDDVYNFCINKCMYDSKMKQDEAKEFEKQCSRN